MTKDPLKQYQTLIRAVLLIVSVSLILYFCLQNYTFFIDFIAKVNRILQPIFYGILFAYLLSPICSRIEEALLGFFKKRDFKNPKRLAHLFAVGISIILFILIILAVLMLILPRLSMNLVNFIDSYPEYYAESEERINALLNSSFIRNNKEVMNYLRQFNSYLNDYFTDTILPNVNSLINSFSSRLLNFAVSIFNFLIGLIVAVYCLDKRKVFSLQAKKLLFALVPEHLAIDILERVESANTVFLKFLIGKIIDSAIIGVLCFIGVLILRIPNPVLISVFIGVSNIIPFFGPFIGAIPCTILILLENPLQALYFVIFIFLLQQFDGNILGPKILGDSTGITSFWILFSILLFGGLWGIFGMLIAVPLFVVIYNAIREYTNYRLEKKGLPTKAYEYEDIEKLEKKEK